MEAEGFSEHAAVVVVLPLSFAVNMGLLKAVMMIDEGKAHSASGRVKAAIKDNGGVDVGKGGSQVGRRDV